MDNSWRSLRVFLVFAGIAVVCAAVLARLEVTYAHPSQKESLRVTSLLPVLALGALGSWLWGRAGLAAPPIGWAAWRRALLRDVGIGAALGLVAVLLDYSFEFSRLFAAKLGVASIHVAFPHSVLGYTAGAVVVESLYRLIPIPVALWVISRILIRGRGVAPTFWIVAMLTSFIEPLSQAGLLRDQPLAFAVTGTFILGFNLFQAWSLRVHGVAAPLVVRIAFYMVWHVALGPLVVYRA